MANSIIQIWEEFHGKLHGFILSRVGDVSVADDILQEVFLRVHTRLETFKKGTHLQAWLYQITRHAIVDYYRARKPDHELPEVLAEPEKTPAEKAKEETQEWLIPMIQHLPEPYREALMLAEIERLPQKEVAARQGVTLTCAKSRIQRGRILLRQMLFSCCHIELDRQGGMLNCEPKPETLQRAAHEQSPKCRQ
jgi:RNA polymerase sigma-70 factor (ECF subfamily)